MAAEPANSSVSEPGTPLAVDEESLLAQPLLQQRELGEDEQKYRNLGASSSYNATSQHAIVGANLCPIESLDHEIIENEFFNQDWRSKGRIQILQYTFMKWTLCFLIGFLVSLIGFFINLAVENIAGVKFVLTSNMMLTRKYMAAFSIFASLNLGLTLFASLITAFVAPEAAGSGIPEVKAYLNGVDTPEIFSWRTLLVKIFGSISAVSSSLHIGKAGPLSHTGACVAAIMGQCGSKKYRLTWKWFRFCKNDRDRRDLITCGAAAGIAVAFRAPVGGLLFALEEMSSWWRRALLFRAFFATAVVAVVLRALISVCLRGKCGLFGKGGLIMFDVTSANVTYQLTDVPPVIILGIIGGILGSLFNFLLEKVMQVYNIIYEKGTSYRILLACFISICTSCLLFGLPWLASCQPCPLDQAEPCPTIGRSGNYKKFQCPPGHYNDLASLFFNTNDNAIKNLFSKNTDSEFHPSSVLIFFITCFLLSIFSYGIVAPAGLFVPLIVTGASYGRLVGMLFGSKSNLNHGLFAVLGSASLLGGSMRTTVALCVIILELTNNLLLLPLTMFSLLISKTVADAFNENVYDMLIKLKGLPYLEAHAEPYMRQLTVGDVVTGPIQLFSGIEKIVNIVHVLKTTKHNAFPVMDEPPISESPILFGLILRAHLITLLKKKPFLHAAERNVANVFYQFSADDFEKEGLGHGDSIEDLDLSDEEMNMFIDLHPFSNASPYTVIETMSLAKAHVLFREVGLRHLLVIPKNPGGVPVVGILTRHDFCQEHILNLNPSLLESRRKGLRFQFPKLDKLIEKFG